MTLQTPQQQRFSEVEETLLPPVKGQQIQSGFSKVLAFLHGWDALNSIWRMLKTDARGNVFVKVAAQSTVMPKFQRVSIPANNTYVLVANKDKVATLILNYNIGATLGSLLYIKYNPSDAVPNIALGGGYGLYEDNWGGDITITNASGTQSTTLDIIEYF